MGKLEDMYGSLVFDTEAMRKYLPSGTFKQLMETVRDGKALHLELANVIAHAMKEWAIEKGATHYTHWFQPLSGITSEKHDSFVEPLDEGHAITVFSGKALIQGEPDASSFPNGGLRATFEARGYTAWDPTSFAFIKDEVLCIPTAFCSYNGDALDKKTPVLRAMRAVEVSAKKAFSYFGDDIKHVDVSLGAEQEYFLISEKDYEKRLDIMLSGRTMFGYAPCKGQELEEHYFGAIRPAVNEFMKELDDELWKLGIPAKTKHNEVAPCQHELACVYSSLNRAIDQNLLIMEKMKLLAAHHGLACLEHEKPFDHINGSGKHNNFSIVADGKNLFDPGKNPISNLRFLVALACVVRAVDKYQGLLRMTCATAGNDHRLGGNEAPPSIVSMFVGDEIERVINALESDESYKSSGLSEMDLGVDAIPNLMQDNTDRNRTSPFAFTGNKFEFRMPGSAQNLSDTNVVICAAMADSFDKFARDMDAAGVKFCGGASCEGASSEFENAAYAWVKETIAAHKRIIFNGDGYSADWVAEAERRGLLNLKTTADALPEYIKPEAFDLFGRFNILNEAEVRCRYDVKLDKYNKIMNIECRVAKRLVRRNYLPAIERYAAEIAREIYQVEAIAGAGSVEGQRKRLQQVTRGAERIHELVDLLNDMHHKTRDLADGQQKANIYAHEIVPIMDDLRAEVDALELICEASYWPVPTYNDILFYN